MINNVSAHMTMKTEGLNQQILISCNACLYPFSFALGLSGIVVALARDGGVRR